MSETKQWFAVDVTASADAAEAVEYAFNTLAALGTEINDFRKDQNDDVCVVGYFDALPDGDDVADALEDAVHIYGISPGSIRSTAVRTVPNSDWLAEWKKHWKPTAVGKFVIAPPWSEVADTDKIVIRIEPNMAFGTGTHETTQLCLEAMSENYRPGQTFLDVGTGTGILAIAAANVSKVQSPTSKIGEISTLNKVLALDTDTDSIKIARENAVANGLGDSVEFFHASINDGTPVFDFVCANLTLDVIVPMLPMLIDKTRMTLVLSGILVEQKAIVEAELRKFEISNLEFQTAGEWIAVIIYL